MNVILRAIILSCAVGSSAPAFAEEPPADQLQLKDGSTLFLHPDGTGRMVDQHGKGMTMADGVVMETVDGRMIVMKNHRIWVRHGPPGKEHTVREIH